MDTQTEQPSAPVDAVVKQPRLTQAQRKALAALFVFGGDRAQSRIELACKARGDWGPGYPLKTMTILMSHGLVEPEHDVTIKLVEQKVCRCACDRWIITDKGRQLAQSWNVKSV